MKEIRLGGRVESRDLKENDARGYAVAYALTSERVLVQWDDGRKTWCEPAALRAVPVSSAVFRAPGLVTVPTRLSAVRAAQRAAAIEKLKAEIKAGAQ